MGQKLRRDFPRDEKVEFFPRAIDFKFQGMFTIRSGMVPDARTYKNEVPSLDIDIDIDINGVSINSRGPLPGRQGGAEGGDGAFFSGRNKLNS